MHRFYAVALAALAGLFSSGSALAQSGDWSGLYAGFNLGWATSASDFKTRADGDWPTGGAVGSVAFINMHGSGAQADSAFSGGGQVGWNVQLGRFVLGPEADFRFLNARARTDSGWIPDFNGCNCSRISFQSEASWVASARARFGLDIGGALFYTTAGLGAGRIKSNFNNARLSDYNSLGGSEQTRYGWAWGGGVELPVTSTWSVRAEYLRLDLGATGYRTSDIAYPSYFERVSVSTRLDMLSVGLNYRF